MKRIIETLSAGFEAIARRPWILLVPILLDLLFWLGPQVSIQPLIERGLEGMLSLAQPDNPAWTEAWELWEDMDVERIWREFGQRFNLLTIMSSLNVLSFLSLGLLDLPSLTASNGLLGNLPTGPASVIQVDNGWLLLGALVVLMLVGLLLSVIYQGLIAQQVREEQINPRYLARRLGRYWLHVMTLALAVAMILALIMGPVALVLLIAGALSPFLVQTLTLIGSALAFWFALYIMFIPHGILLGEEPPLRAWWTSMNIVHKNFWLVLFLLILIRLIRSGLGLVWPMFTGTIPGTLFAIAANAFVGAGLAAAGLVFFRDCYADWREHLAQVLLAQKQRQVDKES